MGYRSEMMSKLLYLVDDVDGWHDPPDGPGNCGLKGESRASQGQAKRKSRAIQWWVMSESRLSQG